MAVLTWRNVDTPRGNDSEIAGLGLAAHLLSNSSTGLSDALGNFGQAQTTLANNAAAQAALQYQDPDQLKAALASGSLLGSLQGVDPSRVSAATTNDLQTRVGTLINNATNQETLKQTQYNDQRVQSGNALMDAAQPVLNKLSIAHQNGDMAGVHAILSDPDSAQLLQSLRPDQLNAQTADQQKLGASNTTNAQSALSYNIAQRTDADNQAGLKAAQAIAPTAGDARTAYDNLDKLNLSPGAYQAAAQHLATLGYANPNTAIGTGAGAAIATAAGAPGTKGGSPFDMVYGAGQYGTPSAPLSSMSIGDVIDYGQKSLIPATAGKVGQGDKGTSAGGAYQITQGTLQKYAPKVLGDDWQSQTFTPQVQDKIAQAIFEDNKGGNLKSIWTSLPDATAGAYKDKSWDDMRGMIAKGESSADPASLRQTLQDSQNQSFLTQGGLSGRNAQNNALTAAPGWQEATKNTGSVADIADQASKGQGPLAGSPASWISDRVQQIMDMSDQPDKDGNRSGNQLNAAQAELILEKSLRAGSQGSIAKWFHKPGPFMGGSMTDSGLEPDMGMAGALVKQASAGMPLEQNLQTQMLGQQAQALQAATDAQTQAYTQLQAARMTAAGGRTLDPNYVSRLNDRYAAATARVTALNSAIRANTDNKPQGQTGNTVKGKDVAKSIRDAAVSSGPPIVNDPWETFRLNPAM